MVAAFLALMLTPAAAATAVHAGLGSASRGGSPWIASTGTGPDVGMVRTGVAPDAASWPPVT